MPEWIHTLTVDASYDEETRVTGVGVVVQARVGTAGRGPILEQLAEAHTGVAQGTGETFAVLRALEIARDRGFTRIKIRSDYNAMRRHLRERHRTRDTGDNDVQRRVLELARQFVWIDFGYVPRRKNQIAHALARKGRLMAGCAEDTRPPDAAAAPNFSSSGRAISAAASSTAIAARRSTRR